MCKSSTTHPTVQNLIADFAPKALFKGDEQIVDRVGELSNQMQRLFIIRCPPLQTFAWAVVQCSHRFLNIFIRILRNVLMFRAIFP